jgi:hypothetical protein
MEDNHYFLEKKNIKHLSHFGMWNLTMFDLSIDGMCGQG